MPQELSFEAWKSAVKRAVAAGGFPNAVLDEEILFMSYDMEEKSVEEATEEFLESLERDQS
jgi:hypothetical protein